MCRNRRKVIFLDIDGVLATQRLRYDCFDKDCLKHLNRVLTEIPDLKIVISSTWRWGCSLSELKEIMYMGSTFIREQKAPNQQNELIRSRVVGMTPMIPHVFRGKEIEAFINKAKDTSRAIEDFVIIDDENDMEPYMDKLVRTDSYTGMSKEHADEVIRRLK